MDVQFEEEEYMPRAKTQAEHRKSTGFMPELKFTKGKRNNEWILLGVALAAFAGAVFIFADTNSASGTPPTLDSFLIRR
jgi:hypothetical protein